MTLTFWLQKEDKQDFQEKGSNGGGTEGQLQAREAPSAAPSRGPGSEGEGLRAGPPALRQGSECRSFPSLVEEDKGALQGPGPPGSECLASACARGSSSSLWQQQEEGGLQEAAEAAECSHEPMGAEAGLRADHTLEDIGPSATPSKPGRQGLAHKLSKAVDKSMDHGGLGLPHTVDGQPCRD